jgi:flagellar basal body-associated protein FliL
MARPTKPKDLKPKTEGEGEVKDTGAKGGGGGGMSLDIKFIFTILAIFLCSTLSSVAAVYFVAPMVLEPVITAAVGKGGAHGEGEAPAEGEHGEGAEAAADTHKSSGLSLELDEFTVNLKTDAAEGGENTFLRAKMALTISVPPEEDCHHPAGAEGGGGGEQHAQAKPNSPKAITAQAKPVKGTLNQLLASTQTQTILASLNPSGQLNTATGGIAGGAAPVSKKTKGFTSRHHGKIIANGGGAPAPSGPEACLTGFKDKMGQYIPTIRDIINSALMHRTATQLSTPEGVETLKDEIKEQINQVLSEEYKVIRVNFQDFIIQR